jgi:hypothetical protein
LRPTLLAFAAVTLLGFACGPSDTSSHGAAARCSPQAQQLTFAGAFSGTLMCTGGAVQCKPTGFGHGYTAHIEGDVATHGVVLDITVGGTPGHDYRGPGSYATGPEQTEPAAGVRLTAGGLGSGADWRSQGGGDVVVASDHSGALAGSLNLSLIGYGGHAEQVSGNWSCVAA